LQGFIKEVGLRAIRRGHKRGQPTMPVFSLGSGDLGGESLGGHSGRRGHFQRKIVYLPPFANFFHGLSANAFRVCQLIAELLHLLPRLDAGHLCNIVVIQPFRVPLQQAVDLFFVGHGTDNSSKKVFKPLFSQKIAIIV